MRVKVTAIHKNDGFYPHKEEFIGRCGTFQSFRGLDNTSTCGIEWSKGFIAFDDASEQDKQDEFFMHDLLGEPIGLCFAGIQFEVLEEK